MLRTRAVWTVVAAAAVLCAPAAGQDEQAGAGAQGQGEGSATLPYHPPLPSFSVQPWEMASVGGGLPPEPLVYHSNAQKHPPSIMNGLYSPLAAAHHYPAAASPYFPYTPPNMLPRALPGPYNQLPLLTPEVTGNGAYLPHTYVPGALYPNGFGAPSPGYAPNMAGAKDQPDADKVNPPPGSGNGAGGPGVTTGSDAGADLSAGSAAADPALLEVHQFVHRHGRLSAYAGKRGLQIRALRAAARID